MCKLRKRLRQDLHHHEGRKGTCLRQFRMRGPFARPELSTLRLSGSGSRRRNGWENILLRALRERVRADCAKGSRLKPHAERKSKLVCARAVAETADPSAAGTIST